MISDSDIYRVADLLIRQHGDDALIYAVRKASAMFEERDMEGATVWKQVLEAVEELLSKVRPQDALVH